VTPPLVIPQFLNFCPTRKIKVKDNFLVGRKLSNCGMARSGSIVTEHSPHPVKVKGLSLVTIAAVLLVTNKCCS
jgi:hypothetical protein